MIVSIYVLKTLGDLKINTSGFSMYPFLGKRSTIWIGRLDECTKLRRFDIVVFPNFKKNKLVAHRIYKIDREVLITKGDNCRNPDGELLEYSQVVGYVRAIWKFRILVKRGSVLWYIWSVFSMFVYPKLKRGVGMVADLFRLIVYSSPLTQYRK